MRFTLFALWLSATACSTPAQIGHTGGSDVSAASFYAGVSQMLTQPGLTASLEQTPLSQLLAPTDQVIGTTVNLAGYPVTLTAELSERMAQTLERVSLSVPATLEGSPKTLGDLLTHAGFRLQDLNEANINAAAASLPRLLSQSSLGLVDEAAAAQPADNAAPANPAPAAVPMPPVPGIIPIPEPYTPVECALLVGSGGASAVGGVATVADNIVHLVTTETTNLVHVGILSGVIFEYAGIAAIDAYLKHCAWKKSTY